MCVSCGCNRPNDDHGDSRNITLEQIRRAAEASGSNERDVAKKIQQSVAQSSGSGNGSVR